MEKSQSSLHKAFYNGGVVDIPHDYPHDSAVLISADGNTKFSVQESRNIVETIVVKKEKDKSLKTCKGCTRRYFKILMKTIRILSIKFRKKIAEKQSSQISWRHDYSRVDRFFLLFFPLLFLVFNICYWGYFLLWDWWYKEESD